MGSGTLSKQALEVEPRRRLAQERVEAGPEHNILTNELPEDAKPRATFSLSARTRPAARRERRAIAATRTTLRSFTGCDGTPRRW